MAKNNVSNVATKIVTLLTPLDSVERKRVIQGALALLGEDAIAAQPAKGSTVEKLEDESEVANKFPRAKTWMRQNSLTSNELEQVFHIDGENVEIIASIPGRSKKEKTIAAYLLQGISKLLSSGEPTFDDKSARDLCKSSGCYDNANHSVFMAHKGNRLTGSKDKGWKLTAPGLADAAAIVKEITKKKPQIDD